MQRPRASVIRGAITVLWLTGALYAVWQRAQHADVQPAGVTASERRDRGDVDGAIQVLRAAGVLQGKDPALVEMLGGLERERGRLREAEEAFRAAVALAPRRPEAALGLADILIHQGQTAEAAGILAAVDDGALTTVQQRRWLALAASILLHLALIAALYLDAISQPPPPPAVTPPEGVFAFKDEYGFRYDALGNRLDAQGKVISPHTP